MSGATSATVDIKYDFTPYDGTPGDMYDKFEERLMNGAARADDRGWSLADHFGAVDEGSPGGPPIPGGAAGVRANAALRKRQKDSYQLLVKHITSPDLITTLQQNHFQDGQNALLAARAACQVPVDRLRLRELDNDWPLERGYQLSYGSMRRLAGSLYDRLAQE